VGPLVQQPGRAGPAALPALHHRRRRAHQVGPGDRPRVHVQLRRPRRRRGAARRLGIKDVPGTLQAAANAAAGGGKGTEGLKSIVLALSQIQSKGRLSQEEINQLTEGGAITAQRDLTKGLHLTAKELQNVGGQGIEAKKALDVLTRAWTSGKMAGAAKRQLQTLSGQWGLFTGTAQKDVGLLTAPLARDLERTVIPAANRAADQINEIFGKKGLSNEEKMRQARAVIKRELGPIGDDLKEKLDEADIPEHLGELVGAACRRWPKLPRTPRRTSRRRSSRRGCTQARGRSSHRSRALEEDRHARPPRRGRRPRRRLGKAKPVPVFVTNWGGEPGGKGLASKAKDARRPPAPRRSAPARGRGRIPAAGDLAPALAPARGPHTARDDAGPPQPADPRAGASSPSNPAGSIPPPGFGTGPVPAR
jgi:tape measure domain-containing protein